jgi:selenocysteine lyase/cysteine desulfurase
MAIKRALADALPNQGHYFNEGVRYKRFTPAGPDHAQIAACAGMVDYLDAVHAHHFDPEPDAAARGRAVHDMNAAHEVTLLAPLIDYLRGRNDVRLLGPQSATGRVATVSMVGNRPGYELSQALVPEGIMAGGGDFYAVRLLQALGVEPEHGALRLSFVHYTNEAEVAKLIKALDKVL